MNSRTWRQPLSLLGLLLAFLGCIVMAIVFSVALPFLILNLLFQEPVLLTCPERQVMNEILEAQQTHEWY